jgi:anti-anti-sigma factor
VFERLMVIPQHIIIDLSQLTLIDSTGLRLLLRASALVDGAIWVRGASRQVSRVLEVSGVSNSFCLEEYPVLTHSTISKREIGQPAFV